MNNMGSTTLSHPVFNNLEQVIIFCRVDKNNVSSCSYLSRLLEESTKRLKTHALNLKANQNGTNQRQKKQQQRQQQKEQGLKTRQRKIKMQTMRQTIYIRNFAPYASLT